jgi:purine-binding chemotaxis protein CheW
VALPALTAGDGGVLTVRVAGQAVALPAGTVQQVIRPRALTRVPHAPVCLLGLANLRGTVLPVVSLARLMGREASAPSPAARVVVLRGEAPVGLLVDAVAALGHSAGVQPLGIDALLAREFAAMGRHAGARATRPDAAPETVKAAQDELALFAFILAGQEYALPLDKVLLVARLPAEVTAVPQTGDAMRGVVAFRGGLLPLVSPHVLLGLSPGETTGDRARIVVTRLGPASVGLVVDRMTSILRVPVAAIDPVPPVLMRGAGEARVEAIGRLEGGTRLVSILSPARLFDDETASRILADAAREAEDMAGTGAQNEALERFVVFRLGDEHYGLPIATVDEVARRPESLTRIPRAPAFVEGVMNLRGQVIPVIDQRRRFAANGTEEGRGRRIVVVTIDGLRAGFAVDSVTEILAVPAAALAPAPDLATDGAKVFDRIATLERDGRMILLVDPRALLDSAERDLLAAIAAKAAAKVGAAPAS